MVRKYPKLIEAKALDNHNLQLLFSNGEKKLYDFTSNLSHPYYKALRSVTLFKTLQ